MSAGRAAVPFGGHAFPYAPGTLRLSGGAAGADGVVLEHYRLWKRYFVRPRGDGMYAVYAPDAAYPYVAEAQGYGMVISALMAGADPEAREVFDGILRYVLAHPSAGHPGLHAAQQDGAGRDVGGANSATDGDLDIAYGLLLADRQWGGDGDGYRVLAIRRIDAIREAGLPVAGGPIKLGDWSSGHFDEVSRTSDWMPGHFRAFHAATGDPRWGAVLDTHLSLAGDLQRRYAPDTGLLPDFVVDAGSDPKPAPGRVLESEHDGDLHWNACRDPWRLGTDAAVSGDARSRAAATRMGCWMRAATHGDPGRIRCGYRLDGAAYGEGAAGAFVAPFAVAAMVGGGGQEWLDALWAWMAASPPDPGRYYSASVQLQVMLMASHNWWPP
ncbi:glycosyl hydrolase family 8 [Streptomyces sp. NPDC059850]|uniref:glycosyl hydrolase family 8 n=1 Tax=Streptomyces sp. NPDC059850 TaxID=3346970 RepID=UPI0036579659